MEEVRAYFASHTKFIELNFAYVPLEGLELKDKLFLLVDFNHTVFRNIVSHNLVFHMCFFDYAIIDYFKVNGSKHTN